MPGHLGIYYPHTQLAEPLTNIVDRLKYTAHHHVEGDERLSSLDYMFVSDDREIHEEGLHEGEIRIYIDGEIYDDALERIRAGQHIQNVVQILQNANGYFSATIFDERGNDVYLITDRFGLKPLYIWRDGRVTGWCSELKGLLPLARSPEIDKEACRQYLQIGFLPGDTTWYKGINLLPASSTLRINLSSGMVSVERHWNWNLIELEDKMTFDDAVTWITHELNSAIDRRMVPRASNTIALSGGLDSRVLAEALKNKNAKAFTFGHSGSDDVELAKRVASVLDMPHHFFEYREDNWLNGKVASVWRTEGMMPFFHLHSSPFMEQFMGLGQTVFNGFGGASLLGGLFLGKGSKVRHTLKDVQLDYTFYNQRIPESVVIDHHMRRFITQGSIDVGKYLVQRKPYMDLQLIEALFSLPSDFRRHYRLFHTILRNQFSERLLDIPWENTAFSIRSPTLNRWLQRLKWPTIRRLTKMGRPAFDYPRLIDKQFRQEVSEKWLNDKAWVWDVLPDVDVYRGGEFRNLQEAGRLLSLEIWLRLVAGEIEIDEGFTRL